MLWGVCVSVVRCVCVWCKQVWWDLHMWTHWHTHTHTHALHKACVRWMISLQCETHTTVFCCSSVLQLIQRARPVTREVCSVRLRHYFCFERETLWNVDASRRYSEMTRRDDHERRAQRKAPHIPIIAVTLLTKHAFCWFIDSDACITRFIIINALKHVQ